MSGVCTPVKKYHFLCWFWERGRRENIRVSVLDLIYFSAICLFLFGIRAHSVITSDRVLECMQAYLYSQYKLGQTAESEKFNLEIVLLRP